MVERIYKGREFVSTIYLFAIIVVAIVVIIVIIVVVNFIFWLIILVVVLIISSGNILAQAPGVKAELVVEQLGDTTIFTGCTGGSKDFDR